MKKLFESIDNIILKNLKSKPAENGTLIEISESDMFFVYKTNFENIASENITNGMLTTAKSKREYSKKMIFISFGTSILLFDNPMLAFSSLALGLVCSLILRKNELYKNVLSFEYNLSSALMLKYCEFVKQLEEIESNYVWHVIKQPKKIDYEKFGVNGHIVFKENAVISNTLPVTISVNICSIAINGIKISLVFLPDCILYETDVKRVFMKYTDLTVEYKETNVIEDTLYPKDSETIEMIRNHTGKGSKLVPIKKYGEVTFRNEYEQFSILTSNVDAALEIKSAVEYYNAFNNS